MKEATILRQFFRDQFGSGYDVQAFRNAVKEYAPSEEIMRIVQSTSFAPFCARPKAIT